ncbi:MAG: efflux RND transporter periplasmic adaptor subunit [Planctomycetes bacterium]|nr:efflux RND transporter periplasmic adaptor subunit [Planctomycetota bacterium]
MAEHIVTSPQAVRATPNVARESAVVPRQPEIDGSPPPPREFTWWLRRAFVAALVLAVGLAFIVALGLAQRLGWISAGGGGAAAAGGAEAVIHTCPMHPQIRQPGPGSCPICGMPLVPATSASADDRDEFAVHIEPAARRLANIQTAEATYSQVFTAIRSVGAIAIDESRMATIAAYVDGRIERLFADYTGVEVAKGDHLAVLYSPGLYSAQVEYLQSRKSLKEMTAGTLAAVHQTQERLVENARQKLVELGMTDAQMAELEQSGQARSRLTIYAPFGGTVIEKMAVEGKYVKAGDPIYRLANLSTVWLMLELFPDDASRIRFGQEVEAEIQSLPGQVFHGRVAFIDPVVSEKTRTVGVRVEFLNADRRLRPGDYATATIRVPVGAEGEVYDADLAGKWISPMHPQIVREQPGACPICGMDLVPTSQYGYSDTPVPQPASLVVPRSAVLTAGTNSVLYVETEPGRFEIRPVTLGPMMKDQAVVLRGLEAGEKVATAGNFLIDSQMQLAGKPSLIDPAKAIARKPEQEGPLKLAEIDVMPDTTPDRIHVERLYDAYFAIQEALASDRLPTEQQVAALRSAAERVTTADYLPATVRAHLKPILAGSEHLHHLELPQAREEFKTISHSIIRLASQVRSADAETAFVHFYCPMVKHGGGDWLQRGGRLANPYFGSKMLRCGEKVHDLPPAGMPLPANE